MRFKDSCPPNITETRNKRRLYMPLATCVLKDLTFYALVTQFNMEQYPVCGQYPHSVWNSVQYVDSIHIQYGTVSSMWTVSTINMEQCPVCGRGIHIQYATVSSMLTVFTFDMEQFPVCGQYPLCYRVWVSVNEWGPTGSPASNIELNIF